MRCVMQYVETQRVDRGGVKAMFNVYSVYWLENVIMLSKQELLG